MFTPLSLSLTETRGGLESGGSGWTDPSSWLLALIVLVVLGAVAWWAARPAGRVRRRR